MDAIRKDIYVTRQDLPVVIKCTQSTNALPWIFRLMDYNIPASSTARIYVKKPSGKEVYNSAAISGNEVTVTVTTQMVAEDGRARAQVQIVKSGKVLNTFVILVDVQKSVVSDLAVESTDEYDVLDGLINDARKAASDAEQSKQAAANSASTASSKATAAANSASSAESSKTAAAKSASDAAASNTAAGKSASAASTSASAASTSATTAGQHASAAQTAKTAAEAAAKEAAHSAEIAAGTKKKEVTLDPEQWTGNAFPYLYTISLPGTTATQRIYATAAPGLTEAQINAFAEAVITGNSQKDGQIVLQAVNKPSVELPIVIEIGGVVTDAS